MKGTVIHVSYWLKNKPSDVSPPPFRTLDYPICATPVWPVPKPPEQHFAADVPMEPMEPMV